MACTLYEDELCKSKDFFRFDFNVPDLGVLGWRNGVVSLSCMSWDYEGAARDEE
jgi:hypothetical protein